MAIEADLQSERLSFFLILNAFGQSLEFELSGNEEGRPWRRWIDTALDSPDDIVPWETAPAVSELSYRVEAHSVVMLFRALA